MAEQSGTLTFNPGLPVLLAAEAKRLLAPSAVARGQTRVDANFEVSHGGTATEIITRVHILFYGETTDSPPQRVFETRCAYECPLLFTEPPPEEQLKEDKFIRGICTPIYVLASAMAQDMAWKMGYRGVEAPIFVPRIADDEGSQASAKPVATSEALVKPAPARAPKKASRAKTATK
ncbi:MAG: hypothetical protein AB1409_08345 [Pseudomonadota bacterium]